MKRHTVDVGGLSTSYTESGGTGRPVVLVHGNSSSSRTWTALQESAFGRTHRCLAIDLPGHGASAPAADAAGYSLAGYATHLAAFAEAVGVPDAVLVGWSLGGHIALEAAPLLPRAPGVVVFGTPPVGSADDIAAGFLPHPAMAVGFSPDVDDEGARSYATAFLAPGSTLPVDAFVADILATDGAARAGLHAGIEKGLFADEPAIARALTRPLAVLHGEGEQLVDLDYLRGLTIPALWRGAVQVIPGAGHAPQEETPETFAALLAAFVEDLPAG